MNNFGTEYIEELDSEQRKIILPAKEILKKTGLKPNMTIADMGCGTGFFTIPAANILGNEGKVYAFDIERKMLTRLRMKIEKPNIVPILINGDSLPLKDKLLDYVLVAFVLNEVEDLSLLLAEIKRVIKHSGIITIIDWVTLPEDDKALKKKQIDQNDLVYLFNEGNIKIEQTYLLNPSHYLIQGKVQHS